MEQSQRTQLSYEGAKSVIRFMSIEKRIQIHCRIPYYRKTNALFPYAHRQMTLSSDGISIGSNHYTFDIRRSNFGRRFRDDFGGESDEEPEAAPLEPALAELNLRDRARREREILREEHYQREDDERLRAQQNQVHIRYGETQYEVRRNFGQRRNPEEAFIKLFDAYISTGTTIEKLLFTGFPKFLKKRDPSKLQFKVRELKLSSLRDRTLEKIVPFIGASKLKKMNLDVGPDTISYLDLPMIKNCEVLNLNISMWNERNRQRNENNNFSKLSNLRNMKLNLILERFTIDDLQRTVYFANGVKLSIDGKSELVVYGGPKWKTRAGIDGQWTIHMEVMAVGDTTPSA
nr:protein C46E10.4 [imported] - Caenorhabditis elegans [Caenorhabditis elegans]